MKHNLKIAQVEIAEVFSKIIFHLAVTYAHPQYAFKIFLWLHIDCFKTLREVDYVNLIRYIVFNLYNV